MPSRSTPAPPTARPVARLVRLGGGRAAQDAAVVGAKAAGLARATEASLPVLAGWVVPAEALASLVAVGAAELAGALTASPVPGPDGDGPHRGGAGSAARAQLAVAGSSLDATVVEALGDVCAPFQDGAIVRSSSPLEGDPRWAGAFATYHQVGPAEMVAAVLGCVASAFSRDVVERSAELGVPAHEAGLAVLVQPWLPMDGGGTAVVAPDGVAVVTGVKGDPAMLVAGHGPAGATAAVDPGGTVEGDPTVDGLGPDVAEQVAALVRSAHETLGTDAIEWGMSDGHLWLLQVKQRATPPLAGSGDRLRSDGTGRRSEPTVVAPRRTPPPARRATAVELHLARLAARYPAPLGDLLVLPWAVALAPVSEPPSSGVGRRAPHDGRPARFGLGPAVAIDGLAGADDVSGSGDGPEARLRAGGDARDGRARRLAPPLAGRVSGGPRSPAGPTDGDLVEMLRQVLALAETLKAEAWGTSAEVAAGRWDEARRLLLGDVLGAPPPSRLDRLRPPHPASAARLLELVEGLGRTLAARGALAHPDLVWRLSPGQLGRAVAAPQAPVVVPGGPDRWEPFVAAIVAAAATGDAAPAGTPGAVVAAGTAAPTPEGTSVEAVMAAAAGTADPALDGTPVAAWASAGQAARGAPVPAGMSAVGAPAAAGMSAGRAAVGTPVAAGAGAGRVHVLGVGAGRPGPRAVLVAPRPVPQIAPLLWGCAALVTVEGSPAAHLFEVTRSLGVPAVAGVDVDLEDPSLPDAVAAVDGDRGVLSWLTGVP